MKWTKWVVMSGVMLIVAGTFGIVMAADPGQPGAGRQAGPRMMCQDRFDGMDANHDGIVSRAEFMAAPHPGGRAEEVFKAKDANGDGSLTKEEFCAGKGMGGGGKQ